ncbi:hypothetical protein CEXT_135741 [Caerostris extrusa]|uniref:Uncharacterized protein n=1 Tax=Caerostris extrusa TaxID=172846 RepID=A0AAV4Q2U4_CAEEX|nr:hypothetical protein CEXT_135741 [Caerostris extrusa]
MISASFAFVPAHSLDADRKRLQEIIRCTLPLMATSSRAIKGSAFFRDLTCAQIRKQEAVNIPHSVCCAAVRVSCRHESFMRIVIFISFSVFPSSQKEWCVVSGDLL